jgi:putative transposase
MTATSAGWCCQFNAKGLCLRDVEELLAERGIEVSYETVRCWTRKFGQTFASNLRRARPAPTGRWHPDEMVVKVGGKRM